MSTEFLQKAQEVMQWRDHYRKQWEVFAIIPLINASILGFAAAALPMPTSFVLCFLALIALAMARFAINTRNELSERWLKLRQQCLEYHELYRHDSEA
jgi:putative Mn2+ efflux pump MntP